jgi:prepilin signal peptidase PulO-like enzyme (type II secretory pathway)
MNFIILIVIGLCFGSFVNALVYRLHKQETTNSKKGSKRYSIVNGRSMCVHCHHMLAWYDLLPLLSWVSLGGKCRYCHKPISWQYPIVELVTALLFVFTYLFWPSILHSPFSILQFAIWLILLTGFMALVVYDLHWMELPDRIVKPLQVTAAAYVLTDAIWLNGGWSAVQGAVLGVACSAGLFYALYQISKGRWIGGGDVKLAVVLGLILGAPSRSLLMIFVASALGTLISLPMLVTGKLHQNSRLPFGPLLITATIIVFLFGAAIIQWYEQHLLFV